jgi:hypothetical protein
MKKKKLLTNNKKGRNFATKEALSKQRSILSELINQWGSSERVKKDE